MASQPEPAPALPGKAPEDDRRQFFEKLVWMGTVLFGALASLPLVGTLLDPAVRRGRGRPGKPLVRLARLDDLEPGVPRKIPVVGEVVDSWTRSPKRRLGAVWLVRGPARRVTAFTAACPHLGCGIDWNETERTFRCPCHDSAFRPDGRLLGGPAPRGMDELQARVVDGEVMVRFVRFRQGGRGKVEVG